jgi:hypothetical protein
MPVRVRALKLRLLWPYLSIMPESVAPRSIDSPEIRYQPSLLSLPSAASSVKPDTSPPPDAPQQPRGAARRKLWFFTALSVLAGASVAPWLLGSRSPNVSPHVHSGKAGFRVTPSGEKLHWKKKNITVHLDPSLNRLGSDVPDAVIQAFGSWVGAGKGLPNLTFEIDGNTTALPERDGKSTVSYSRIALAGHERDLAITVTYADEKSGEIIEADIVLNSLHPLGVLREAQCDKRYDVQNVTTHEVGHFFGLGEDPSETGAAMFQLINQCEVKKRVLSGADVQALEELYLEQRTADGEPDSEEDSLDAALKACTIGAVPASGAAGAQLLVALASLFALRRRAR